MRIIRSFPVSPVGPHAQKDKKQKRRREEYQISIFTVVVAMLICTSHSKPQRPSGRLPGFSSTGPRLRVAYTENIQIHQSATAQHDPVTAPVKSVSGKSSTNTNSCTSTSRFGCTVYCVH